jgi:thioesterase domain-containing protein
MKPNVYFHKGQIPAFGKVQNLFFLYGGKDQKNIAPYLDQNQILIGIDFAGRDGREIQTKTIEAFGELHMQQILKIQPQGPFFICGYSFGGLVAFEIAQRLNKLGHKVDRLMLIDTFPPDSIRKISGIKKVVPPVPVYSMAPRKILGRFKRKTIRFLNWKFIGEP